MLGGVETILEGQAKMLAEGGHQVTVVAGRGDAVIVPELDSRHPRIESITRRLAAGEDASSDRRQMAEKIEQGLRPLLESTDVVVAHNVMTMHFNLPLTDALVRASRPVLAWTHDITWVNPRYSAWHRDDPELESLHRPAPGVRYTAISARVRQLLSEAYGVDARVVPNGLDRAQILRIRPSTFELLERAGALGAGPFILIPFRVTRRKRIDLAMRAFALLAERRPEARMVVSGPLGPHSADNDGYWDELADLRHELGLEGRAIFLREFGDPHPVDGTMIAELYQLATAVLLTSESEGFGLPVVEAAMARVPVVASDIDVFRELAGDDAYYFPVDAEPEAIAARLEEAISSPVARLQARVGDRYDWRALLEPTVEEILRAAG